MTRDASPAAAGGRSGSGPNHRCPGCNAPVDATARFCPSCGVPQPSGERPASELPGGERRHLTILFCDLVGSTALSQELDPEELGEIVLAYQEMGRSVITNFGGHVAQYLGDGLLAYFGYPTAHEDDAERAVLAGLAILSGLSGLTAERSQHGVRLEARVGIHAGPAVVGEMGGAGRSDTSAFGSTPNIAARLEAIASPGTVVISDEVCRSLGARFEVVDLGTPDLKGVARPIRVWQVTSVGQRAPRGAARRGLAMIGRHRELGVVLEALARADAGEPSHVLVVAEPGLGKTRLVQALYEHVEERDDALWLEGQCSELTAGTPLAPVVQFLRRYLGLDDAHTAREREQKLREAVKVLGAGADDAAYYLGELLGVAIPSARTAAGDEGPEVKRRRTLNTLAALVRQLGRDRIVVVVVEDLHWSDPTTIELVALLAALEPPARVLSVATSRRQPETSGRHDDRRVCIELSNLDPVDAESLARALATEHGLPADAGAQVARRSDGVPLFIEELVKAAADLLGVGAAGVPQTLQALLASRLDLLGDARHVAQAASVLGREFPRSLLAAIAGMADDDLAMSLDRLVGAGIVTYRETATGVVYTFRHALIQDAAYDSLLRRNRRGLHTAAATALTTQFADLVRDSPEIVAHHLVEAERPLDGAEWYETAGRRAAERAALREARSHFENGIGALESVGPSRERSQRLLSLNVLLANTLMGTSGIGNEALRPVWDRAIVFAQEVDDPEEETAALNGLAVYHMNRGDLAATEECVDRTLAIADRVGSRIAGLRGHGTLAQIRIYQARGSEAREHVLRAMSLSRPGDFFKVTFGIGHDQETYFHVIGSWASWWLGRPDEALATARQGLAIASRIPSSLSQAMARHGVAMMHSMRREPEAAAALARESLEFTANLDFPYWLGIAEMMLGTQLARLGDPGALKILEDGLTRLAAIESLSGGCVGMSMLAEAYLHAGRFDDAIGAADAGLASADMLKQPICNTELLAMKGRALVALRRVEEGVELLEQSLATGRAQGAVSATLQTVLALAPLLARPDPRRARTLLTDALAAMADGADTPDQLAARAQLAELGPNPQGEG